jgi:hypothetical protein
MDSWPQDHQRHKVCLKLTSMSPPQLTPQQRNYDEMAQHATLSPSPSFFFRDTPQPLSPVDNTPIFIERRRTSHPHNQPARSNYFSPAHDAQMPRPPSHRPNLEHRTSQTIIDLTDDAEEADQHLVNARLQRLSRRPQLDRSDSSALEDIIDLTEDIAGDEVEITGTREIPGPPRANLQPHSRRRDYLRFLPGDLFGAVHQAPVAGAPHRHHRALEFMDHVGFRNQGGRDLNVAHYHHMFMEVDHRMIQDMPGILDYNLNAFNRPPQAPIPPKPKHDVPVQARKGFTRSPTEEDVVICPCCEEELVAKKGEDEKPLVRKGGKSPSKKDREEHPFWVIRDCGHVSLPFCTSSLLL